MSNSNLEIDEQLTDLLAQAKAIRFAAQHGALSYEAAKKRVAPLLERLNIVGKVIAKKYKRKFREIKFHDL